MFFFFSDFFFNKTRHGHGHYPPVPHWYQDHNNKSLNLSLNIPDRIPQDSRQLLAVHAQAEHAGVSAAPRRVLVQLHLEPATLLR